MPTMNSQTDIDQSRESGRFTTQADDRMSSESSKTTKGVEQATQVVCVAYTNEFSIDNNSLVDLHVGCAHRVVSSNQEVLNRATSGSLVIVTSQSRHFVLGILGDHTERCAVWAARGGHVFKYTRTFTPITDVLPIALVESEWNATCQVHEVPKDPKKMFHSRFCGYGSWYITALKSALQLGVFPRSSKAGTHMIFE